MDRRKQSQLNKPYQYGAIIEFDDIVLMIRRSRYLRCLSTYFTSQEIIEGLIENPLGNTDEITFMDTACNFIENEYNQLKLEPVFGTDLYYAVECISLSLESLQNYIDIKIAKVTPIEAIEQYKVTRWLGNSTALISMNPMRTIR